MKQKMQSIGKALSGMVMPNIGAFIAWGFITALFIEAGWIPNEKLAQFVTHADLPAAGTDRSTGR